MVELVDTSVLEADAMRCVGSSPTLGTIYTIQSTKASVSEVLFLKKI